MTTPVSRRRLRPSDSWPVWASLAIGGGVALACIIPDREIVVYSTEQNDHAVRFVEGIPLDVDAGCACNSNTCECPMPAEDSLPTFLDPSLADYKFCICSEGRVDDNRLNGFQLLVEDADEFEGEAKDRLYAVALLDWDPSSGEPAFDYVAYRRQRDPRTPLPENAAYTYDTTVIKRPRPWVRAVNLFDENGRFDLCNGAGFAIEPGFHTLSVMVSDRFWFTTTPELNAESDTADESDTIGFEAPDPVTLDGVPDIAEGATYDIQSTVFYCLAEGEMGCGCVDEPN